MTDKWIIIAFWPWCEHFREVTSWQLATTVRVIWGYFYFIVYLCHEIDSE